MITGEFKQNENTFPISGSVKTDGTFTASANIRAVKISGVPDPSHIPNLSDGLFKAKINYSSSGKQIAVFSELNGNKMIMVGEFNINKNNLIIDGVMNRSSNGEEETVKSKWTLEKVSEPTVDKIKNAPDVPVIQP